MQDFVQWLENLATVKQNLLLQMARRFGGRLIQLGNRSEATFPDESSAIEFSRVAVSNGAQIQGRPYPSGRNWIISIRQLR